MYEIDLDGKYAFIPAEKESKSSLVFVAANNSSDADKRKADIVLTGNDDADILNNIIESLCASKGGEIVLFPGDYIIDTLKSVTYNRVVYKYGLYIPHDRGDITIRGIGSVHKYSNVSFQSNYCGATIRLSDSVFTSLGNEENVAVIGSYPQWTYSLSFFKLKNIAFYIPDFTKQLVVVDGKFASEMSCEDIFISSGADVSDDSNVNPKCIGIRACNGGNNGRHYCIDYCKIIGVGTAFHIAGEHLLMKQCAAQRCAYGFVFGEVDFLQSIGQNSRNTTGIHNITMTNCCFEYVWKGVVFGSGQKNAITITDLNCEDSSTDNVWKTIKLIEDVGNGSFRGYISYYLISTSTWQLSTNNLWGDQSAGNIGIYWETVNLMARRYGNTSQRPTQMVDVGFRYLDTEVNKEVVRTPSGWTD